MKKDEARVWGISNPTQSRPKTSFFVPLTFDAVAEKPIAFLAFPFGLQARKRDVSDVLYN
jgi:hypothetical protein